MKTTVKITHMLTAKETIKDFITEQQAYTYFVEKCDEMGYEIEGNEAGGHFHDFRVELIETSQGK